MSIRDVLVHVDAGDASKARIETAVQIARRFEAHLTGLYPYQEIRFAGYAGVSVPQELIEVHLETIREQAEQGKQLFNELTAGSGLSTEWRSEHSPTLRALNVNARYADLVICGQDEQPRVESMIDSVVEDVVLQCARPVLVVPYIGALHPVGHKVMVAWDGSRESVRAVHDAMPLLKAADHVRVMAIQNDSEYSEHGEIPCADICLHLARHGVNAEASSVPSSGNDIGGQFLSMAADDGIDLIVMGAYGHSRLRELVLGGATRSILRQMTVPVLMSH